MALPTGQISFGQVNTELNLSATAQISLNDSAVRTLAGVPSGQIAMSNLQGKSNLPAYGSAYQGGYFAGQISTAGNGVADYNLVVGPLSSAQSILQWKVVDTSTTGTSSVITGPSNSAAMNDASHPAAQFCEAVSVGGYSDWYMPAKNELEVCYYNLKPTTTANNTSTGANTNAVPSRSSNYTSGTPAQTSATNFRKDTGAEAFADGNYWSSTQASATEGWRQQFDFAIQYAVPKTTYHRVRAIRRVAV